MESLRELFRIGVGPSSSHTLGPAAAARAFRARCPAMRTCRVDLFGSLAATGRGHGTDRAIERELTGIALDIRWHPDRELPLHPNGVEFTAWDADLVELGHDRVYSVGGGALRREGEPAPAATYPQRTMAEVLAWCGSRPLSALVAACEPGVADHLDAVLTAMDACVDRGLSASGPVPGGLVQRKARHLHAQALGTDREAAWLHAFALAAIEENAAGGVVVTAPTCGGCGPVPAALRFLGDRLGLDRTARLACLATAGVVGNLVKRNASISGAEVGCQGEVGTACAMAAAALCQGLGGSVRQVEYAAEIALEHHLGMTCDPVLGLVQVPCIERNALAASRALDCAHYARSGDGSHTIPFDEVVETLLRTGHDLQRAYRETAEGGLAVVHRRMPGS